MSDFFIDLIEVLKLIPKVRFATFGRIAKYLAAVKSSRSGGWALNNFKLDNTIPAYRGVDRNGFLTGNSHFPKPNLWKIN